MLDETQTIIESSLAFLGDNHLLAALLIILSTFVIAWLISRYVITLLEKLASKTKGYLDDRLIGDLRRPLFSTVLILGLASATVVLRLPGGVQSTISSVLQTLAILVWTLFALRFIPVLMRRLAEPDRAPAVVNVQSRPLFQNITNIAILVLAVYYIFSSWHVDMTAWIASAGIMGIAVAFAAKDTLANLFSGVFILADRPYEIGNFVVLGTGERGEVTHIGMRSTRLLTRDDIEVTVPNSIMGNTTIVNESGGPHEKFRIRVQVGVAYGTDIDEVRAALLAVAAREEYVCDDPGPRVRFRRFGASGLDFELLCWIDEPVLSGRVIDTLNSSVYKLFQTSGIEIPYAKRDIYVKELPVS